MLLGVQVVHFKVLSPCVAPSVSTQTDERVNALINSKKLDPRAEMMNNNE